MTTPNLELPEVPEAILGASDEINEGFWALDVVVQLSVIDKDLPIPPVDAPQGSRYIVPVGGTGPWALWDRAVAYLSPQGWRAYRPRFGWKAYVQDEQKDYLYDGTAWVEFVPEVDPEPDPLDVLTTQGDLLTIDDSSSAAYARLPRGANGQVLQTDDTEPLGLRWVYAGAGGGSVPLPVDARVNFIRTRYVMGTSAPAENADGPVWNVTASTNVLVAAANSSGPLLANAHRRHRTVGSGSGFTASYVNNIDAGPCVSHAYANRAGFSYQWIGGIDSMMSDGSSRLYIALHSDTGVPSNADPSSFTNIIAFAADAADANMQLMHNDVSGTATKVDLGVSKLSLVGKLLIITITCQVGGGDVSFSLYVVDDAVEYTAIASADLPATGTIIIPRNLINDTGVGTETAGLILIDMILAWSYGVPAGV